jgi:hypothetical protein
MSYRRLPGLIFELSLLVVKVPSVSIFGSSVMERAGLGDSLTWAKV